MKITSLKKNYPYILLSILFFGLLIRNRYGFCWSDESLYVSNMYRLYNGDAFLIDDWHKSILSSYVTLPLFSVYMWVKGSTEGVYLFFRDVMVILAFADAIVTFKCLHKHFSDCAALVCSICLLIYSRANICGVSYYNIGLHLFVLAVFAYYYTDFMTSEDRGCVLIAAFFGGIILGLSIIVNPYILLSFPFFIIGYIKTRRKSTLMLLLGCVLCGLIFIGFYLCDIEISQIEKAFVNLHHVEEVVVRNRIFLWFTELFYFFKQTILIQCIVFFTQICLANLKIRIRTQVRMLMFLVSAVCLGINLISSARLLGGAYIAFSLFGLQLLPAVWEKSSNTVKRSIIYFYVMGILLSVAFGMASNTGIDASGIGFVVTTFGAVQVLFVYRYPDVGGQTCVKAVKYFVLTGVIGITLFLRIFAVYRDGTLNLLKYKITQGPAKGIYTTQEHLEQYNNVIDDIHAYVPNNSQTGIFVTKLAPWAYLCTNARCAVYQTWRTPFADPMLETYFRDHPKPDYILVLDDEYGGFIDNYMVTWGEDGDLTPNANDISGYLLQYVQEHNYQCISVKSGTIYQKQKIIENER